MSHTLVGEQPTQHGVMGVYTQPTSPRHCAVSQPLPKHGAGAVRSRKACLPSTAHSRGSHVIGVCLQPVFGSHEAVKQALSATHGIGSVVQPVPSTQIGFAHLSLVVHTTSVVVQPPLLASQRPVLQEDVR
jgi:hypothetical protein